MSDVLIIILFITLYFSPVLFQLVIVLGERKKGNLAPLRKFKKVLRITIIILIPLFLAFLVLIRVNYLDYESPKTFDEIENITFANFRGLEFFKKELYGNERFAYVVTTIEHEFEGDSLTVQSLFHPSRSFVYKKQTNSEDLLEHEMYHFRITELYTRIAKKRISELQSSEKNLIENILDENWIAERKYQQQYDYDTFHSYVFKEQKRYEREIDSLLLTLKEFSKPKIHLND